MKKDLNQLRQAFLEDTINYYSVNPRERRCISPINRGQCAYHPTAVGKTKEQSEGCAIGRHLSEELALEFDALPWPGVANPAVANRLPINLKRLGITFLKDIQQLHDQNYYWDLENNNGLSPAGEFEVERIIKKIHTDVYAETYPAN